MIEFSISRHRLNMEYYSYRSYKTKHGVYSVNSDLRSEIYDWIYTNTSGDWNIFVELKWCINEWLKYATVIQFENEDDAILFRLTWLNFLYDLNYVNVNDDV